MSTGTAVRERPILFGSPMVRAILAGHKTQARRIVKPQPDPSDKYITLMPLSGELVGVTKDGGPLDPRRGWLTCPFGIPGDRLWVREKWRAYMGEPRVEYLAGGTRYLNVEDDDDLACLRSVSNLANPDCYAVAQGFARPSEVSRWRSPIHMPRWASRITLEVTSLRAERVRAIGKDGRKAADVLAEGVDPDLIAHHRKWFHPDDGPALAFAEVWDTMHGYGAFARNDWVWVVEFTRVKPAGANP